MRALTSVLDYPS